MKVGKFIQYNLISIFLSLGIIALSISPKPNVGVSSYMFGFLETDKFGHAVCYALLTFMTAIGLNKQNSFVKLHAHAQLVSILYALSLGLCMELIQQLLPHRQFDLLDMLANLIGVIIGLAIFRYIYSGIDTVNNKELKN